MQVNAQYFRKNLSWRRLRLSNYVHLSTAQRITKVDDFSDSLFIIYSYVCIIASLMNDLYSEITLSRYYIFLE